MSATVSAFRWVPPFAQGYVRDLRVRWALEEAGRPYEAALLEGGAHTAAAYRRWQPFGQVPAYRDDEIEMFESGAIVLTIAEDSDALCPRDRRGRARMTSWVLAALNSVEPSVQSLAELDLFHAGEAWVTQRRPQVVAALRKRLGDLAAWLDGRDFLEDRFTAGDLMMATVLRNLTESGELARLPQLAAYLGRCLARPAFERALAAQMNDFRAAAAPG